MGSRIEYASNSSISKDGKDICRGFTGYKAVSRRYPSSKLLFSD
jgi:hypothetical protein